MRDYKSPCAALLWSIAMPGCGQIYNRDWFLGLLLLACEFIINCKSNLNQAIFLSFHFDLAQARTIIDYQWGLFYPSIYTYAIWNAFNQAVKNNFKRSGKKMARTFLTGFLFSMDIGMVIGISLFVHPVFDGLLLGIISGFAGHGIEQFLRKKNFFKKGTQST